MRVQIRLGYVLTAAAPLAFLAGCLGGSGQSPGGIPAGNPVSQQSTARQTGLAMWGRPEFIRPGDQLILGNPAPTDAKIINSVYVGQFKAADNVYALPNKKNVPPKCTIAGVGVNGLGVNPAGVLFLPQGGTRTVTTYFKGSCTQTVLTLDDPDGQPSDVAFASTGTTYVTNIFGVNGAPGNVAVYPKGARSPSRTLTDASMNEVLGIATDSKNNVYVSYINTNNGSKIIEFPHGQMPGQILHITANTFIIGITFDDKQDLIAVDAGAGAVLVYAIPYRGAPTSSFATRGESVDGKLDSQSMHIYLSDLGQGTVDVFAFPTGTYLYSFNNGLSQANDVEGIGVYPSENN